jgi:hypothetical protein
MLAKAAVSKQRTGTALKLIGVSLFQDTAAHQSHLMAKYRNLASEYSRLETQTSRDTQTMVANEQEKEAAKAKTL